MKFTAEELRESSRLYHQLLARLLSYGYVYAKHGVEDASNKAIGSRGLTAARLIVLGGFTTGFDSADTIPASDLTHTTAEYREALFAGSYVRKRAGRESDTLNEWTEFVAQLRAQSSKLRKAATNRAYDVLGGQA